MSFAVSLSKVSRYYDEVRAVDEIDLEIAEGEFFALLGPSGSGKTTCLRLIAGFETTTSGRIEISGEPVDDVPPYRRNVNTVFQDYALFPHLNVADNVAYGLMIRGIDKSKRTKAVDEALEMVRLPGFGNRRPGELSGGQRQRVALARAIINQPKVLLLDEPLGALDLKLREQMQEELRSLQQSLGITFIFVTHDQGEALSMADRIAIFNAGKVIQVGTPEHIYQRPDTRFVADFVGSSNVLSAEFAGLICAHKWVSLRPEAIQLVDSGGKPAKVIASNYLGGQTRISVEVESHRLNCLLPFGQPVPSIGNNVQISWNLDDVYVMEKEI